MAEMRVVRGRVEAYFPDFSYNFLSMPRSVKIREKKGQYAVVVAGGDASSSYMAEYTFVGDVLTKRRIVSKTFPDDAWEETTFKFNLSER